MLSRKRMVTIVITGLILATAVWAVTLGQGNAQRLSSTSTVTVVDANNKVVGRVQSIATIEAATASVAFVLPDVSQPIFLAVTRDKLHGSRGEVVFESTDCTGTPYLFQAVIGTPPDRELSPQTAVVFPGSTLYVQDLNLSPQLLTGRSIIRRAEPCTDQVGLLEAFMLPAIKTLDLDEQFTPPFTTR